MANVGVHSYIITEACSISSELLYSMVLTLVRIIFFLICKDDRDTCYFCIPWMFFFSRPASEEIASTLLLDN